MIRELKTTEVEATAGGAHILIALGALGQSGLFLFENGTSFTTASNPTFLSMLAGTLNSILGGL